MTDALRRLRARYDLSVGTLSMSAVLWGFFALFLAYSLAHVVHEAFVVDGRFSLTFFRLIATSPVQQQCIINSLNLGVAATVLTTLIALPLAYVMANYSFRGKQCLQALLLVPMVMPPFVGAIGMQQFFARFGSVNLLLMKLGIIHDPVDWFAGAGFLGVVILEALHLYPIMYLNVAAAMANVDPSLEEAARNLGASRWRVFRTITSPLMLPGYFAGAVIVFIWAFTDLGTPLVFHYRNVIAVQIFEKVADQKVDPMGYALVVLIAALTLVFFYLAKRFVGGQRYEMLARGHVGDRERPATGRKLVAIYATTLGVIALAMLPHISVALTSITQRWFMTVLPTEVTLAYYGQVFTHDVTLPSIKSSLFYSSLSTVVDVTFGVGIAYLLTRKRVPGAGLLDATAMLPLALPGLVLAFGYVGCFSGWRGLDPRENPTALLIVAYAVRRLPYALRAAYAGFQQTSVTLEEASLNLGASPMRTLRRITLPLVAANLVAGAVLAFAFAMLEVSDSLVLAMREQYYPITKAILAMLQRPVDGPYVASAMGVLGMALLAVSLLVAGSFLGKRMGELFRA